MESAETINCAPDMEVTPKRALAIKRALVRQYADQYGLEIDGWTEETKDGIEFSSEERKLCIRKEGTTILLKNMKKMESETDGNII